MRRHFKQILRLVKKVIQPEVKSPSILLLGNSLIELGDWKRLLNRNDLVNRGIGGDTLSQIQKRIKNLNHTTAKIAFIEGGINDFPQSDPHRLFTRYQDIIAFWQSKQIIPVITGLVYISPLAAKKYPFRSNWRAINDQVAMLNEHLKSFCIAQEIDFIDLNPWLSDSIQLHSEYTTDGVHLSEGAYLIWADQIKQILHRRQI